MNDITFMILKIVISVCAALITAYVIPYLRTLKNDRRYAAVIDMVALAVRAAEQTIRESGMGAVKKEQVIALVQDWMREQGYDMSYDQLSSLIEACVYQMKKESK